MLEARSSLGGLRRIAQRPTSDLVILALIAALLVGGLVLGTSEDEKPSVQVTDEELARVAERVERIRGLRFKERPVPEVVTSEQAREEAVAELERSYPPEKQQADENVLKLLGLLEPEDSLRSIEEAIFGGQVAGFYDTRRNRLAIVEDVGGSDAVSLEVTLAHELVHALEDQRFELREGAAGADDRLTAYTALVEGTATAVQTRYMEEHIDPNQLLALGLSSLSSSQLGDFEGLPQYVQASLLFPYLEGERFVSELHRLTGSWRLVDLALRKRAPDSTEQVLHPEKFLRIERPAELRLDAKRVLGDGWRRSTAGAIGEFDTAELLKRGNEGGAAEAAAGWGGGRYESWRAEGEGDCPSPCRERSAMVVAWAWDKRADAREFRAALPAYLEKGLDSKPAGSGRWSIGDAGAAIRERGDMVMLALAPSPQLAARLADRALVPR